MHTSIMFALSREQNKVLKNTFMTLSLTMITTIIGVFLGLETIQYTLDNPLTVFILSFVASIILMIGVMINSNSGIGVLLLFPFTTVMGYIASVSIYAVFEKNTNGQEIIMMALAGTGVILVVMSIIALFTKVNLVRLGPVLFSALIGIIVMSVIGIIFNIPLLLTIISVISCVVFSLFILHDVNMIVTGEQGNYVEATLLIYLNIMNLFLNLLSILSDLSGD